MVGVNLAALGAKLGALPEGLVDSLGLQTDVERELSEQLNDEQRHGSKARSKGRSGAINEKTRRAALHTALVAKLFMLCERDVPDENEPFHVGKTEYRSAEGRQFQGRESLPPCTPAERSMLEHTGTVVKEFAESIQRGDYMMI